MILELNRKSHVPLYTQIAQQVRAMISRGTLKTGDRLPANRELAQILGVNRTTVTTAYAELLADGLINSFVGRGTFICAVPGAKHIPPTHKNEPASMQWGALLSGNERDKWLGGLPNLDTGNGAISLAYSLPHSELFPIDEFRKSVDRVLRREGRVLIDSGAASGYRPLQDYIAGQMALSGCNVGPDQILITSGCQQALNLVKDVLIGPDDEVAIESPTYPGALSVFCRKGSKHIAVTVGPGGIDLDALEDVLERRRPKLIYTIPSFHNPTGVTINLESRRRLLELALRYKTPIIEDDIYGELRYEGAAIPSLKALDESGVVIYVNSFSKIGFPGVRVGWIAADQRLIRHLAEAKRRSDLHTSLFSQAAIYEFSRRGLLASHVKRLKKAYTERRNVMLSALERHFPGESHGVSWTRPEGGMAVWVTLPESLNASQILLESIEKGVVFSPGDHFFPDLSPANNIRLSFTTVGREGIEDAIRRLSHVLKARLASVSRNNARREREPIRALV